MKKVCTLLLSAIMLEAIQAQNFTEITGPPFVGVQYSSISFADVDNDNDQDVLITGQANSGQFVSTLYSNNGNGIYSEVIGTTFSGVAYGSVAFEDVDGDNDQDVLITGNNSTVNVAELYINDGNGNFSLVTGTPFDGVHRSSIAFSDVDGDSDQDILITGFTNGSQRIAKLYSNDGLGNFTLVSGTPFSGVWTSSIAFSDVDGDNDEDVLITGRNNANQRISELYINDGNGVFSLDIFASLDGVNSGDVEFSDVDGDNDQDLLITGYNNSGQYVAKLYKNNGSGSFNLQSGTPFVGVYQSSIQFADIDNDSDQDVLISGLMFPSPTASSKLYRNNGSGIFTLISPTTFEDVTYCSISFADIDGDNDQDVLITGRDSSGLGTVAKLYENDLISVGIKEKEPLNDIYVYPNPVEDYLSLKINSSNYLGSTLFVFNVFWEIIFSTTVEKEKIQLKTSDFDSGIYFVQIIDSNNQVTTMKFIKK